MNLQTLRKASAGPLAGLVGLLQGACIPADLPEGSPLHGPVDRVYDQEALLDLAQQRTPITKLTPELFDFLNEFYAFVGHHQDLAGHYLFFAEQLPFSDGLNEGVFGAYYHGEQLIGLHFLPFSFFLGSFFHETEHQYDHSHDKVAVAEVASALFFYVFDPHLATDNLFPTLFHRKAQEGYVPFFWSQVAETGNPLDAWNLIRDRPHKNLDWENSRMGVQSYPKNFRKGLARLRENPYFFNLAGRLSEGHLQTFLAYLQTRRPKDKNNEVTRAIAQQYLAGLEAQLDEGDEPNPLFLHIFLRGRRDYGPDDYGAFIQGLETVDPASWPINPAFLGNHSVATVIQDDLRYARAKVSKLSSGRQP